MKGAAISEILTIDLKELEEKVENGKGLNHKEATVLLEFVRKIIGNGGTVSQPQLTIPNSVADSIKIGKSKLTPALAIRWKGSLYNLTTGNIKLSMESLNWVLNGKSKEEVEERNLVLFAYLNPLTRDLVKVVEGLNESKNK